ncbi:MAG: hypothetical protein KatS3mg008_0549 [Acidimicrobiales bacterium]|nr:MAG: hypothetical protein KatS3mg008_0549 [Acidimicrobiales bacterium]
MRRGRFLVVVTSLAAWLAVGCSSDGGTLRVGSGAGTGAPPRSRSLGEFPVLPTLPPPAARTPHLFDSRGCLRVHERRSDCSVTSQELAARESDGSDGAARKLASFSGLMWTDRLDGDVRVLVETVTTETVDLGRGRTWRALGLVRNETAEPVESVVVHAELRDRSGRVVGRGSSSALVGAVRPGEPVPFALEVEIADGVVEKVRWSADPGAATDGAEVTRRRGVFELSRLWERHVGDASPLPEHLVSRFDESQGPPADRPVLVASASNWADRADALPVVTAAWISDAGRVLAVARGRAVLPGRTDVPPGAPADVALVPDRPMGVEIAGEIAAVSLWAEKPS